MLNKIAFLIQFKYKFQSEMMEKPKPHHLKLEDFLDIPYFNKKLIGINFLPAEIHSNPWKQKLFLFLFYFRFILILLSNTLYGLTNGTDSFQSPIDFEKLALTFSCYATGIIINTKFSCTFWNQDKLQKIFKAIPTGYSLDDCTKFKIVHVQSKFQKFFRFYVKYSLFSFIFVLAPIVKLIITGEKSFPFAIKFPFDATRNEIYPFAYLWVFLSHGSHIFVSISNDAFHYGLIIVVCVELKILASKFEELKDENDLKKLVDRQIELVEVVKEIQKIFSVSFVANFILSSFIICFTAFKSSTSTSFFAILLGILFCISCVFQIVLQCYFGQMLKDSNENVMNGIYNCGWENFKELKTKKSLILILQNAQSLKTFSVLGISEISIEQFTIVSQIQMIIFIKILISFNFLK